MSATERIELAAEALVQTIKENGYRIDDIAIEDIQDDQVELFRYPPEEYHTAVCAVPDGAAAQQPQPRPPTYSTGSTDGQTTVQLSIKEWEPPHNWDGEAQAPAGWPHTAVDALIQLFTGHTPDASAHGAVALPVPLARHIAVLIEDWCANCFDHTPTALQSSHIQCWYGQGITLYQIWTSQPNRP